MKSQEVNLWSEEFGQLVGVTIEDGRPITTTINGVLRTVFLLDGVFLMGNDDERHSAVAVEWDKDGECCRVSLWIPNQRRWMGIGTRASLFERSVDEHKRILRDAIGPIISSREID